MNLFVHLIGESGDGKTRVLNAAKELVAPNTERVPVPVRSIRSDPTVQMRRIRSRYWISGCGEEGCMGNP